MPADHSDLTALTINCTLTRSPEPSHTATLLGVAERILFDNGVSLDRIRLVDHDVPPGIYPDMTRHGYATDEWPELWKKVRAAAIIIVGSPIWLGEKTSVCTKLIERLYAHSSETNEKGQYVFYGKVCGCVVTGNEDGYKHIGMNLLYSLQHIGFTIPPQADAAWVGEAGPGPSFGDEGENGSRVGFDNHFTLRNTTFMAWNLLHFARMLKDAGGIPAHGNSADAWEEGERFGAPDPASL